MKIQDFFSKRFPGVLVWPWGLIVCGLAGCGGNVAPAGVEVVACGGKSTLKSLTAAVEAIEVVRLRGTDSILVDDHARLLQRDSSFYLVDCLGQGEGGIYRFALDGRLLGKIGAKGDGPEEYPGVSDVLVDEAVDEVVVVSDPYFSLTVYGKDGTFKGKRRLDVSVAGSWKFPASYWVVSGFGRHPEPPCLLRLDTALNVTDTVFLPVNPRLKQSVAACPMFVSDGEGAKFAQHAYPVIYSVAADTVRPVMFFDFGDDYPTWEEIMTGDTKKLERGNLVMIAERYESPRHLLVMVGALKGRSDKKGYYGLKDKVSGRWNWLEIDFSSKGGEWYMGRMCGFAKDGRLMCFFFGNELEELPEDARQLVGNPAELEQVNPETDMFVLLCRLK